MTTITTNVATTTVGTSLAGVILYFASKNGYGDMPPYVAVALVGLIISVGHAAVNVISRLKVWQRWLVPSVPAATPVAPTAPAA